MKNLHKITSKRDVPEWVIAWLWWIQDKWDQVIEIEYNEFGLYCIDNSLKSRIEVKRDSENRMVTRAWIEAFKPQPDWTNANYRAI